MSLDAGLQASADLDNHHTTAVLTIDGASGFPWKESTKKFWYTFVKNHLVSYYLNYPTQSWC